MTKFVEKLLVVLVALAMGCGEDEGTQTAGDGGALDGGATGQATDAKSVATTPVTMPLQGKDAGAVAIKTDTMVVLAQSDQGAALSGKTDAGVGGDTGSAAVSTDASAKTDAQPSATVTGRLLKPGCAVPTGVFVIAVEPNRPDTEMLVFPGERSTYIVGTPSKVGEKSYFARMSPWLEAPWSFVALREADQSDFVRLRVEVITVFPKGGQEDKTFFLNDWLKIPGNKITCP